jgi:hypothetical protein
MVGKNCRNPYMTLTSLVQIGQSRVRDWMLRVLENNNKKYIFSQNKIFVEKDSLSPLALRLYRRSYL